MPDATHLLEPLGARFDDVEHVGAEQRHEPLGVDRPDAADHP